MRRFPLPPPLQTKTRPSLGSEAVELGVQLRGRYRRPPGVQSERIDVRLLVTPDLARRGRPNIHVIYRREHDRILPSQNCTRQDAATVAQECIVTVGRR